MPHIREQLTAWGGCVPWMGDFHYNGHRLLTEFPACAQALSKYRINPATWARATRRTASSRRWSKWRPGSEAVRIGVNWGSLDQELLAALMDANAARAATLGRQAGDVRNAGAVGAPLGRRRAVNWASTRTRTDHHRCKVSGVQDLVAVYRALARAATIALHLPDRSRHGHQRAPWPRRWPWAACRTASATPSASPDASAGRSRTQEVVVALEILQSLGLRAFQPQRHGLPGLRPHHQHRVPGTGQADRRPPARHDAGVARPLPGVGDLKIAVMGCIVNGPGESKHADIGISLPGTGEAPAPVFIDGEKAVTLRGEGIARSSTRIVEGSSNTTSAASRALNADRGGAGRLPAVRVGIWWMPATRTSHFALHG